MGMQPERLTFTLTNYGRKVIINVKRGQIKQTGSRITIDFPENTTRKPKR